MTEETIPREEVEFWTDSVIRRLDHVYDTLDTVAAHNGGQSDVDALQNAQDMIETAQADLQDLEDYE